MRHTILELKCIFRRFVIINLSENKMSKDKLYYIVMTLRLPKSVKCGVDV